ncbi:MAG: hypothetical protein FWD58_05500 [Firmicutes bacterium]|nr:hypothetical protein [Bacillota bacterium]
MEKYFMYGGAGLVLLILVAVIIVITRRFWRKENLETLYWYFQDEWLKNAFENFDVAVYGLRGTGKDVIFAHTINLHAKKHYSNLRYNSQTEVRDIRELNVGGNSYEDFINGTTQKFVPNFEENFHFYISDAGVYLGAQFNKELNHNYGELPIHLALRRHLYDSHLHTNSQALNRPWDKIREQQGAFIHTLGVEDHGDYLIVSTITYTKYESALECLPPPEKPDKYHTLKYGEIVERRFKIPVKSLKYDTRHFKNELLIQKEEIKTYERAKIII